VSQPERRSAEARHFAKWLGRGLSGCEFARYMSPENRENTLSFSTVHALAEDDLDSLALFLDDACATAIRGGHDLPLAAHP